MIHKSAVAAVFIAICAASLGNGSQASDKAPSKELIQYVRDAQRLGLKPEEIRKNAVGVGWPAATVDQAIAATGEPAKDTPKAAPQPTTTKSKAQESRPKKANDKKEVAQQAPAAAPEKPTPAPIVRPQPDSTDAGRNRGVPDDYRIGSGDVLQIQVWKEPDASVPSVVVRPDGRITLPLLKELDVNGLTPTELEKVVTTKLGQFISAPDVTVVVTAINSKKIYLIGAVKKEGPIPFTYRMTVMQALSEGGGLTDYAKRKKIYVLRTENGKEYRLMFDYEAVLKGERMELNVPLNPGDTVVVPN